MGRTIRPTDPRRPNPAVGRLHRRFRRNRCSPAIEGGPRQGQFAVQAGGGWEAEGVSALPGPSGFGRRIDRRGRDNVFVANDFRPTEGIDGLPQHDRPLPGGQARVFAIEVEFQTGFPGVTQQADRALDALRVTDEPTALTTSDVAGSRGRAVPRATEVVSMASVGDGKNVVARANVEASQAGDQSEQPTLRNH
jgi:hypothetical protein